MSPIGTGPACGRRRQGSRLASFLVGCVDTESPYLDRDAVALKKAPCKAVEPLDKRCKTYKFSRIRITPATFAVMGDDKDTVPSRRWLQIVSCKLITKPTFQPWDCPRFSAV